MKSFQVRAYLDGGDKIVIRNAFYLQSLDNTLVINVRDEKGSHSVWLHGVFIFFVDAYDI